MLMTALCCGSCGTGRKVANTEVKAAEESVKATAKDSTGQELVMKWREPIASEAVSMTVTPEGVMTLPEGASYSKRSGRAEVKVNRAGSEIVATATCDSLEAEVELYERLWAASAERAEALERAQSEQRSVSERRLNGIGTGMIGIIVGMAAGAIITILIKKKYGNRKEP
jgi:hypothetical protein